MLFHILPAVTLLFKYFRIAFFFLSLLFIPLFLFSGVVYWSDRVWTRSFAIYLCRRYRARLCDYETNNTGIYDLYIHIYVYALYRRAPSVKTENKNWKVFVMSSCRRDRSVEGTPYNCTIIRAYIYIYIYIINGNKMRRGVLSLIFFSLSQ